MRVLYAGDSEAGGAANYLLGVLQSFSKEVDHVPPSKQLKGGQFSSKYDVIILSDFPRNQLQSAAEKKLVKQVEGGSGLLMVGGWASFSGPFGGWGGTELEKLLPVTCLESDDRLNFSSGAYPLLNQKHAIVEPLSFKNPPAICGLNDFQPKPESQVILSAKKIVSVGSNLTLDPVNHPLLVVGPDSGLRTAAYASDFAPHWCGGLVDWGTTRVVLPVSKNMQIEVSDSYISFIESIIRWLAQK